MRTRLTFLMLALLGAMVVVGVVLLQDDNDDVVVPPWEARSGLDERTENIDEIAIDPRAVGDAWIIARLDPATTSVGAAWSGLMAQPPLDGFPTSFIRRGQTLPAYERGEFRLGDNESIPFELPLPWSREDLGLNFSAELHGWRYLSDFMHAYVETRDAANLEIVRSIVTDWIEHNPFPDGAHPRAWHEGSVMKRMLVICNLIDACREMDGEAALEPSMLLALLSQHAEFLARESSYRAGNHGMRQDLALLVAALTAPCFERAPVWRDTALRRLEEQVARGFSSEGVWREPSPKYHAYVMRLLDDVLTVAEANGLGDETAFLSELERRSQTFLAHVLTPAALFPPLGDSFEKPLTNRLTTTPQTVFSTSGGREGAPPASIDGLFPDAGLVVFRSGWGETPAAHEQSAYVQMHAGCHLGFGHRHEDALSFMLHDRGRWWLIDSGRYGPDNDEWREYAASATAHNTYTFDGEALTIRDYCGHGQDAGMEAETVSTVELAAARAWSTRFLPKDVRAERTLVFLRERRTVVAFDRLLSPDEGDWRLHLHFAPDLEVAAHEHGLEGRPADGGGFRLDVGISRGLAGPVEIVIGQTDPVQGWYSPDFLEIVPSPTAQIDRRGEDVVAATVMRVCAADAPPIRDVRIEATADGWRVSWRDGDETVGVEISDAALDVTADR